MEIIPVIDILGGRVVRARQGRRNLYQPIQSTLCNSSAPIDVVRGLMRLYRFPILYIADLDAIQTRNTQTNMAEIAAIRHHFPDMVLWLDNGANWEAAAAMGARAVMGSESLPGWTYGQALEPWWQDIVLSLDFGPDESRMGPEHLYTHPEIWPKHVICMTLSRVGSHAGPDMERLSALREQASDKCIYAAGGVRDVHDLLALQKAGAAGVLIASALHDGYLSSQILRHFMA